jgi:inner membrane protein
MDNVTHTLVGLMMSRAGIDRRIPRAAGIMMIAANIPDIDIVSGLGGTLAYLKWHRSYTHALAFAPVMALIPLAIFTVFSTRAYLFSLLGVLSHLGLDWTNAYGIRLYLPFSGRWLRLDQTDVVDPWIWLALFLALGAPALARLVSGEISSKKTTGPKLGWAWFALLGISVYEGARFTLHARAIAVMNARLFNGSPAVRLTAIPSRWTPIHWRGIVEGDGFVEIVPVNLSEAFDPSAARVDHPAPPSPEVEDAKRTPAFQEFGAFCQLPFWKATAVEGGTQVELIDLRFGSPQEPGFEARAIVDSSGVVHDSQATFGAPPIRTP